MKIKIFIGFFIFFVLAFTRAYSDTSYICNGYWDLRIGYPVSQTYVTSASVATGVTYDGVDNSHYYRYSTSVVSLYNPDGSFYAYQYTESRSLYDCIACTEPDEPMPTIDASLWQMSGLSPSNSCSPDSNPELQSECTALDGQIFSEKKDCCTISYCFIPVSPIVPQCNQDQVLLDNECVDCPINSHATSEGCRCDTGYEQNSETQSCDELPPCSTGEYRNPLSNLCEPHDCPPTYVPTATYNEDATCEPEDNNDTPPTDDNTTNPNPDDVNSDDGTDNNNDDVNCYHPSQLFNIPFVEYSSKSACLDKIQIPDSFDNGSFYELNDCSLGEVACYYSTNPDTNSTEPDDNTPPTDDNSDSNVTAPIDSNTTAPLSTANIESKLDTLIDKADLTNNSIKSVGDLVSNMNTNLGSKIDGVKNTNANGFNQLHNDLAVNNDLLKGISDNLSSTDGIPTSDSYADTDEATDSQMNEFSSQLTDSTGTMQGVLDGYVSSFVGTSPTVVGTGSPFYTGSIFGGNFKLDLSMFEDTRQYFDILWTLLLAYLNFKIYSLIIRDLLKKI